MTANIEVPPLEYHKMYLHFCSEQCRETFMAHPNLYSVSTETQREVILKQWTMSLVESLANNKAELLINNLTEMVGVKEVIVDGNKVNISDGLLQVTRKQIELRLIEVGVLFGNDWVEHLRRAWVHNSEDNELANLSCTYSLLQPTSAKILRCSIAMSNKHIAVILFSKI